MSTTGTSLGQPALSLAQVCKLLSDPTRWKLLRELCKGEMLPSSDLAKRVGCSTDMVFSHMLVFRKLGLTVQRYRGFYEIAPAFRPAAGATTIDLGHCVVKLDTPLE
ncbi:MAG: helix-turn-helix transcriptional regulator [Verrucomicrobia bacterium]|nr:helix-turn-helix transcriptional regulator [Verrucomicrobiota bacterium]